MNRFIKPLNLAIAAALIGPATSLALESEEANETVLITASRTAQTADEALASVTVITRQEIEQSQAQSIQELLAGRAGLDIVNRGGYGKSSSLFMRGTSNGHVLYLIDGVKVGSATLGETAFQHLPLSQIERIEIVRGPRSSLYGSEAIGGVVQIFTRQGTKDYNTVAEAGVGSDMLRQGSVNTSGQLGGSRYNIGLGALKTDGIDTINDSENDDDGYSNQSGSLRLQHRFDNGLEIDASLMHAEGTTEYDGFTNITDFIQQSAALSASQTINDYWFTQLSAGQSRDDTANYKDATFYSRFATARRSVNWQNDIFIGDDQTLTLGADFQRDIIDTTTAYAETERNNRGIFGQYQARFGDHDLSLSLRNDDNEAFGTKNTGSLAWGYQVTPATRIFASHGTGFKTPTFNDLYYPAGPYSEGNPDLVPEESASTEIGMRQQYDHASVELNAYHNRIDNLIEWAPGSDSIWRPNNVNEASIRGVELRVNTTLLDWQSSAEISWVDATDRGTDKQLQLRAKNSLKLDAQRDFGKASYGVSLIAQGKRYADAANTTTLGGYGIVNLRGQWALAKQWTLKGHINNIGNKRYETVADYNSLGTTFYLGVAYETR